MRDGSSLAGMVTATSPSEITLSGDDKVTHTIPMTQVKSIEYDDPSASQAPPAQAPAADTSAPPGCCAGVRCQHCAANPAALGGVSSG